MQLATEMYCISLCVWLLLWCDGVCILHSCLLLNSPGVWDSVRQQKMRKKDQERRKMGNAQTGRMHLWHSGLFEYQQRPVHMTLFVDRPYSGSGDEIERDCLRLSPLFSPLIIKH